MNTKEQKALERSIEAINVAYTELSNWFGNTKSSDQKAEVLWERSRDQLYRMHAALVKRRAP